MNHLLSGQPKCCLQQFEGLRRSPWARSLPSPGHTARSCSTSLRGLQITAAAAAQPATVPVVSFEGDTKGSEKLSLKVAAPWSATGVVHRCMVTEMQNARQGSASTLTRAEVRGGGKKPFAQKGTGNARRGSQRTPLRPGGGIIFGPKPRDWSIKINKKERRVAVATALQSAAEDITVVDDITGAITQPKTRVMVDALQRWNVVPGEHALLIVNALTEALTLSCRNIPTLKVTTADRLICTDILRADSIIIEAQALKYIQDFLGAKEIVPKREELEASAPEAAAEAQDASTPEDAAATPEE